MFDMISSVVSNLILKDFIDNIRNYDAKLLFIELALYAFIMSLSPLHKLLTYFLSFNFKTKAKEDIKNALFKETLLKPSKFFNDNFSGALSSKISDIINGFYDFIIAIFNVLSNTVLITVVLILFLKIDVKFFLVTNFLLLIYVPLFLKIGEKSKEASINLSKEENNCFGALVDCFTNILSIKMFSREKIEKHNVRKISHSIIRKTSELTKTFAWTDTLNFVFMFSSKSILMLMSLKFMLNNKIMLGQFMFNMEVIKYLFYTFRVTAENIMICIEKYGRMSQALNTLLSANTIIDSNTSRPLIVSSPSILFNNVSFSYDNNSKLIFNRLSLDISEYQKLGLVGYTGSGKSTLINLLLRFYDVNEGGIYIDNQNIKEVTQESLRKNISYIPQDPILFHRTIRENILYGKLDATEEELIEACKKACCYEFINNDLENKFDTLVGERGIKLSGGQKQRIAIARAILKNSKILILDEATSALDSITEKEIQIALNNLMKDKTVIVIAHRLSTLNIMDRIVVIDKGQIIEDGTKEELLKIQNGLFKNMWNMQREGVIGISL